MDRFFFKIIFPEGGNRVTMVSNEWIQDASGKIFNSVLIYKENIYLFIINYTLTKKPDNIYIDGDNLFKPLIIYFARIWIPLVNFLFKLAALFLWIRPRLAILSILEAMSGIFSVASALLSINLNTRIALREVLPW